ncbi:uncharacterized protein LOC135825045 [Sycon ciliatum]|uniref:uncharacterized protein LOC135825045 n=1 Tax=Sycon ciliatum TaxID=27933 RepID=UPI0031F6903E
MIPNSVKRGRQLQEREKVAVTLTTKTGGSLNKQVLKTVIPASTTTASSAGSGQQRVLATASTSSHGSRSTASASAGGADAVHRNRQNVSSSVSSNRGNAGELAAVATVEDDDDVPPPLEPLDGEEFENSPAPARSQATVAASHSNQRRGSQSIIYDTAAEDSLDTLEEKIETLSTWLEYSEKGRQELCDVPGTTDSFDKVLQAARQRLDRLKRLALEKRRVNQHLPSPSLLPRPRCR